MFDCPLNHLLKTHFHQTNIHVQKHTSLKQILSHKNTLLSNKYSRTEAHEYPYIQYLLIISELNYISICRQIWPNSLIRKSMDVLPAVPKILHWYRQGWWQLHAVGTLWLITTLQNIYNISGMSTWEKNVLAIYRYIFEFAYEVRVLHHFENRRSRTLTQATFLHFHFLCAITQQFLFFLPWSAIQRRDSLTKMTLCCY
jgi:hypothetical protein